MDSRPEAGGDPLGTGFALAREGDAWLDELRRAERRPELGSIGAYELIEEVGRGGQGIVYRARHKDGGLHAVKRLLRGPYASEAERRRFEHEVAATAALDHPGIVRVLGWQLDRGEPVLSMEWIDGVPVNRWTAEHVPRREPERVLPLFLSICEVVRHAHRNGVIHRDIKPSNVLVDAQGRPHLLDFGLARSASAGPARSSLVLGTPSYAAPEQLRAEHTVDARADVYSLGVVLWELLTGDLPYDLPPEPTGWLTAIEASGERRASEVRPDLGRELDTILQKALAIEPERRYQSADALAEDVRRLLAGEPILAHAPSALYQLRKLARRHAGQFALVGTVFVLTLAFGLWSAVQAARLERQRDRAHEAETEALAEARRAQSVLDFFLNDVLAAANPVEIGGGVDLATALGRVEEQHETSFAEDPLTRAAILVALGRIRGCLFDLDRAAGHQREAVAIRTRELGELHSETLSARLDLSSTLIQRGEGVEARAILEDCRAKLEKSGTSSRLYWVSRVLLGTLAYVEGRLIVARDEFEAVLAAQQGGEPIAKDVRVDLFRIHGRLGDPERAERLALEWIRSAEEHYGVEHAILGSVRLDLAVLYRRNGRLEEAERELTAARAILARELDPLHPTYALSTVELGELRAAQGDLAGAEALLLEGVRAYIERFGPASMRTCAAREVAADFYVRTGTPERAVEVYRELLADLDAGGVGAGRDRGRALARLGGALVSAGRPDEAEPYLEAGLPELRAAGEGHELMAALRHLAVMRADRGDYSAVIPLLRELTEIVEEYVDPEDPELAQALEDYATDARACGGLEAATLFQRRALELHRAHRPAGESGLARAEWGLAQLLAESSSSAEERELLDGLLARLVTLGDAPDPGLPTEDQVRARLVELE